MAMKLNNQSKYFINGLFLLTFAVASVTHIPIILKTNFNLIFSAWLYYQIEFFLLCACAVFYLFSPKFYKYQVISVVFAFAYYVLFVKCA